MRRLITFVSFMTLMLQISCTKSDTEIVTTPTEPTYDPPKWCVANSSTYEYSMSAIVMLPSELQPFENDNDELAIFYKDECRGTAERIITNLQTSVWMMLIYGTDSKNDSLCFKYYSSCEKSIYKDNSYFSFEYDKRYGTIDNPIIISLKKCN